MGCCALAAPPPPDESVVNFTHFRLGRLIGKGGFGVVKTVVKVSGVDKETLYAMKIYQKRNLLEHSGGVQKVIWELSMLAVLNTPWICNARYAFQDKAHCYLVMDLALGGDLSYHLQKERQFSEGCVRIYLAQIYLAVEYLHSKKILHRDLKPDNVMLDEDGFIKVTDMGLSAHLNSNSTCTEGSGTPGFMAPELYTVTREHSYASDWWAYGITAHLLLTGRRPSFFKPGTGGTTPINWKRIKLFFTADLGKDAPSYPTPQLHLKARGGGSIRTAAAAATGGGGGGGRQVKCAFVAATSSNNNNNNKEAEDVTACLEAEAKEQRPQERLVEVSPACVSFVTQLLQKNPAKRLGAQSSQEVKGHPFFAGFDWAGLEARSLPAPFKPDTTEPNIRVDAMDMFNDAFAVDQGDKNYVVPEVDRSKFDDYHFNTVLQPGLGAGEDEEMDDVALFRSRLEERYPSMKEEEVEEEKEEEQELLEQGGPSAPMTTNNGRSGKTTPTSVVGIKEGGGGVAGGDAKAEMEGATCGSDVYSSSSHSSSSSVGLQVVRNDSQLGVAASRPPSPVRRPRRLSYCRVKPQAAAAAEEETKG